VAASERDGLRLVSVVLGDRDEAFSDAAAVLDHGYASYERRTVIAEEQELGPIRVDGRAVPVVAGDTVDALLPRGEPIDLDMTPDPDLSLPVDAGEAVGVVEALAAGEPLGSAPLVAERTVRPGPPSDDEPQSWWERALEAVGRFFRRVVRAVFG
ncbi:MAG TPA: hypothetical protein VHH92_07705, partial [Actinomycetota bacterium]|nr:hypothetical protein [Actinomycetota bacterium]